MLMRFNEFFATKRALPTRHSRCGKWLALTPMLAVLVVIVVLVSGVFRYWSTAIGSSSMAPNINMGDVVVIDKDYGDADAIETGSVIAFRHDNRVVVHRLVAIHNSADGLELQTKGDNNASEDAYIVHENDLVGVVRWRLPLIGWPTVWIDQTF
jgi:signal peptidase